MDASELSRRIDDARQAAERSVRRRPVADVLTAVDRVITNWMRPQYHLRRRAEEALPAATGFSAEMIRHGLPLLLEPLHANAVRELLTAELGDSRVLDGVCHGRRALGPPLIAHVLSGNIPGLAAAPMLLSLAIKSATLIKCAAGDPIFPALFAQSIADVDEELGRCVVVADWRGGDAAREEVAFTAADLVVASGADAAMAAIASRVRCRFIGHGHKISFAAIGRECLADRDAAQRLAHRLAYDVSLWDQQGCLSPQVCYVEAGAGVAPDVFADLLAQALAEYARALPPRRLSFEEKTQILRFRQDAEWRGNGRLIASRDSTDWTIAIEHDPAFVPSCLNRCVRLKGVTDLAELESTLAPHRRHLEAAGLALSAERQADVAELFARCGVHRVCPLGTMQRPPLSWCQSGRPRVGEWVEWMGADVEA